MKRAGAFVGRLGWALLAVACAHAPAAVQPEAAPESNPNQVSARAYRHYLDALLARNADDLAGAASELREALLYDPDSPHLHTVLAEVLLSQGHVAEAEQELRAAVGLDPRHAPGAPAPGPHRRGAGEARRGAPAVPPGHRVRSHRCRRAPRAGSPRGLGWKSRCGAGRGGHALAPRRAGAGARAADEEADLSLGEGRVVADRLRDAAAGAWLDIARAQVQRHDDAGAGKAFAEARAVLPSDAEALAAEASWLENRGQTEPARALYLQLLAQRPEAPEVLAALARLALLDGDGATLDAHRRKLLDLAANLTPWDGASREGDDDRSEVAGALLKLGDPASRRAPQRGGADRPAGRAAPLSGTRRAFVLSRAGAGAAGRPLQGALGFEAVQQTLAARKGPDHAAAPRRRSRGALSGCAGAGGAGARKAGGDAGVDAAGAGALRGASGGRSVALGLLEAFERAGKERRPSICSRRQPARIRRATGSSMRWATRRTAPGSERGPRHHAQGAVAPAAALRGAQLHRLYADRERIAPRPARGADAAGARRRAAAGRRRHRGLLGLLPVQARARGAGARRAAQGGQADAGDPVVLSHLGDALLAVGNKAEALAAFRSALLRLVPPPRARRGQRPCAPRSARPDPRPERPPRARRGIEQKLKLLAP